MMEYKKGDRVQLQGNHSHTGEYGVITARPGSVFWGWAVKLDSGIVCGADARAMRKGGCLMESAVEAKVRDLEWWVVVRPTKSFAVGTIIPFYLAKKFPAGATHFCDGSELSTEEFPDLYEVTGNTFGGSEGNFNLPDLRLKVIV